MNLTIRTAITVGAIAAAFGGNAFGASERWYSSEQVEAGRQVYRDNCMTCHNEAGAGTENWQQRDANGVLPPPPLNGTAHTWHHDLGVLARTIAEGGAALGGTMPAFTGKLGAAEVAAVIAYVQSLWPEEIYATWAKSYPKDAERGIPLPATATAAAAGGGAAAATGAAITERLARLLSPDTSIGDPEKTPVDGIYGVMAGSRYLYIDAGGRYVFTGEMMDLESRENLTETRLGSMRRERLKEFADGDKVIFPAAGEEKAHLDVFTDTTCPYCRRLHAEVGDLQAAGVTVRYLPFPRSGPQGQGYLEMRSVWCAEDRRAAMDAAKLGQDYTIGDTDCAGADAVDAGYRLGIEVGVTGTPAIVLPDGRMVPGYRPHGQLLQALGVGGR